MALKPTPFLEQIIHLVALFLDSKGQNELASTLKRTYELPEWISHNNPLFKRGLVKIVKEYVKGNEKMTRYYTNRSPPEQAEEVEEEKERKSRGRKHSVDSLGKATSPKMLTRGSPHQLKAASPKQAPSSWISKFEQPKKLEQITGVTKPVIAVEVAKEKTNARKKSKIVSSDFEQEDSFELQPRKKHKKQAKQQKRQLKEQKKHKKDKKQKIVAEDDDEEVESEPKIVIQAQKPAVVAPKNYYYGQPQPATSNGPKKFFSRINVEEVRDVRHELKDNSFQAKAKYGQAADEWGQFGYDKLKDARGESFKKTKGKLKNRAFQGAMMDINKINSIPID